MKKVILILSLLSFVAIPVFAANFSPTPLKLSAASQVLYNFDGSVLNIPLTVSGTPANIFFLIYTKGKSAAIGPVKNGYLGWHYVNKVDTCIYFSPLLSFGKGSNKVTWDGKDKAGGAVPKGDYTYYLWGYDGESPKVLVSKTISVGFGSGTMHTQGSNGQPLANPIYYSWGTATWGGSGTASFGKWKIGNEPADAALLETCAIAATEGAVLKPTPMPSDNNFVFVNRCTTDYSRIGKYQWVPNGESVLDTNWGDNGYVIFNDTSNPYLQSDMALSGDMIVYGSYAQSPPTPSTFLSAIDMNDGTVLRQFEMESRWYAKADYDAGGQANGGPDKIVGRNNMIFVSGSWNCYQEMVDPARDDDSFVVWGNGNGDYTGDHNFEVSAAHKWLCNDFNVGPYKYTVDADANLFSTYGAYDMGAVTVGLYAPDGTGLGHIALSGETAGIKEGVLFVDYGSPFDGIYTDNNSTATNDADKTGTWYVGHNCFVGIISNKTAVADAVPEAFAVAQNSPNPFNPATTISFTLSKAGKTTVEVYNMAGQKVDTLLNSPLNAGLHSVVWNAARFSAGVYFYTVRSGDFARTMKMTLLK
jgi:flagellar hook assembly protein FlgD